LGNYVVPDAAVWAFGGAKPGATSPVIETPFAYYLFRLDSLRPAGVPPLASIRPAVEHGAREKKKWDVARQMAKSYLKRVEEGSTLEQAAAAMKLPHREFGPFSRVNPPLTSPMVVGTAFGLDAGQRSGILDTDDGIYILETIEHTQADSAKFVKELDEYRARAINAARQERIRSYLTALQSSAKIVDNRDKVLQSGPAQDPSSAL
jgi:peptidyl-prolyl cis-trans isomerase D